MSTMRLTLTSPTKTFTHTSEEKAVRIGRSLNVEFSVPKDDLSREHCLVESEGEDYFITDLGSKNGITVDRQRIEPNVRTKIAQGSSVVLANIYVLKINAFDIKTKSDIVLNKLDQDMDTTTFSLDIEEENPLELQKEDTKEIIIEDKKPRKVTKIFQAAEPEPVRKQHEHLKMAVGFIVILGFILYQFLGR